MPSDAAEIPPEPEDPLLGALVSERYKIVGVLGDGGMGRVYEAEHVLIKRRVALKCLHAQYATRADVVSRFRREALAATAIHNKHIVEVTDMGRFPDGRVFLVLEFLDGRDLARELATGGALSFPRAVHVAAQLCDGLGAAHAAGIVHRDLKPENVFLITREGDRDFVKIVDFGISKFQDGEQTATDTGVMLGTPLYMAPEQVQGQKTVDHRVDLYAVGVILFRALTGRNPFTALTPLGLVYQVCTVAAPSVTEHRPDAPPELAAIVTRLMEKDPERRFQSAAALGEALRALHVTEGATPPAVEAIGASISGVQRTSLPAGAAATLPSAPSAAATSPIRARWPRVAAFALVSAALVAVGWRATTPDLAATGAGTSALARAAARPPSPPPLEAPPPTITHAASAEPAAPQPAAAPPTHIEGLRGRHHGSRRHLRDATAGGAAPTTTLAPTAPPPLVAPPAAAAPPPPTAAPPAPPQPPPPDGVYRGPRRGIPATL